MKIAVIGTHGVGKTTLAALLFSEAKRRGKNARFINEVARDCPFPLNDKFSIEGAHWICTTQIHKELNAVSSKSDFIICDRSSIDPILYLHAGKHDQKKYHFLATYAQEWLKTYDKFIYVYPGDTEIINDQVRSTDRDFQDNVHIEFNKFIHDAKLKCICIESDSIYKNDLSGIYKEVFE